MSTRAIIAYPVEKGYITAWQWSDGHPESCLQELSNKFTADSDIKELLSYHSFACIVSPEEKEAFLKVEYLKEKNFIKLTNGEYILTYPHMGKPVEGNGDYGYFETIDDMLKCDLNYVYVFNNGKWETHQ